MKRSFLRVLDRIGRELDEFRVERTRRNLAGCGARVFLSPHCVIWPECRLQVGDDVTIHSFTHIFAGGGVTIGDGTMVSALCSITSSTHPKAASPRHAAPLVERPVIIGRNVWLGTGAIILPGVTVGDDAIVGAGAVVTRDVPPGGVVVGNPARLRETLVIPGRP